MEFVYLFVFIDLWNRMENQYIGLHFNDSVFKFFYNGVTIGFTNMINGSYILPWSMMYRMVVNARKIQIGKITHT